MIMAILFILFALLSHFVSCKRLFEVHLANHLQWVDLKIEAVRGKVNWDIFEIKF